MNPRPPQRARRRSARGATHRAVARGLITDTRGRHLLVLPAIPDKCWYLPGGRADYSEDPATTCEREIEEELGLVLGARELLLTTWAPARTRDRPGLLAFLFNCGTYRAEDIARHIDLDPRELADWQWATPERAYDLLHPIQAGWLNALDRNTRYLH